MEEAENISFLNEPKYFPGRPMAKPYVSCIKIHGVPILPPLLDEGHRREMRDLRARAVAVERRLALRRASVDSGVASGRRVDSGVASGRVDDSYRLSETLEYLSAVSSLDDSLCSVYRTPCDKNLRSSPAGSQAGRSLEQRVSFPVRDDDLTPTFGYAGRESSLSDGNGKRSATDEDSRQTPRLVRREGRNDARDCVVESQSSEKSPNSTTLTASTDLNAYLDNTAVSSASSPTQEDRPQDIGDTESPSSVEPVVSLSSVLDVIPSSFPSVSVGELSPVAAGTAGTSTHYRELSQPVTSLRNSMPLDVSFVETLELERESDIDDDPPSISRACSSHTLPGPFKLVPPNVCLRPTITITDWLLSSSSATVRNDPDSPGGDSPEGSQNDQTASKNGSAIKVSSKDYNDPESGLDLEPSKLVVEDRSSESNLESVASSRERLARSVTEPDTSVGVATEPGEVRRVPADEAGCPESVLSAGKSDGQSADDGWSTTFGGEVVPPLIRQHSFTVQSGPSSLLRSYVEENGIELNTGVFENPKPATKRDVPLVEVADKPSRCGTGRKGWDLNGARALWVSGNKPFAKPKTPTARLKKTVSIKHRTRSVPSIYSVNSLPNSTRNSPEKSRQAYGSVDGLNCKFQTPQKKPRRSLNFADSSPKSETKFVDRVRTNRVGLPSQIKMRNVPLISPSQDTKTLRQVGAKLWQNNPLPVNKTINKQCSNNSLIKVTPVTEHNETNLPLQTNECPKEENSNLTKLLLHLKMEHNKQMAILLEKQRAEQEKIQELFMIQQQKLIEEMQRSYPDAFNSVASEPTQQTEETNLNKRELSREEHVVRPLSTQSQSAANESLEKARFLQENVCNRNEVSRKARRHNNSVSKENLASFLSAESLCEDESNKENVEQFCHQIQSNFEDLTIQSIPLNQSLPHLIISDSDLEILPYANDFESSNIDDQLSRSLDSASHISKVISTLSEEVSNVDLDHILSPKTYKTALNIPAVHHNDSTTERNLQNSINSSRSVENYTMHRSYETLVIHSPQDVANLSIQNVSSSLDLRHSSLGKVRHSPRNSSRSGDDDDERSAVYGVSVQRTYDTLHPSIRPALSLDCRPVQKPSKQEKLAASKVVAAAKGYLIRRLMKTELVQNIIATIAETLKTAIDLRDEIQSLGNVPVPQADLDLRERLYHQLESEHQSLYALFLHSSPAHRVAVIAADRERIKSQALRPSSGQRPLTSATQRSLKRKQEPDAGPTPRSRPSSSRSSRRPLWETSASGSRQRASVPGWVANQRPVTQPPLKPPPRKPWR